MLSNLPGRLRFYGMEWAKRFALLVRGLLFFGTRHRCPCCGWRVRTFVDEGSFVKKSATGYCPRCNSKARHRRDWLYLRERTDLLTGTKSVLEVAPWRSLSRCFQRSRNLNFVGVDIKNAGPHVTTLGNLLDLPFADGSFDAVICIHVLEHIPNDAKALSEMFRVLKPGGWALISVPLLLDEPTREDPSITDPAERERLFGEPTHVRYYGTDMKDRLKTAGFDVQMDPASNISSDGRELFALRDDENIFHCHKKREPVGQEHPAV